MTNEVVTCVLMGCDVNISGRRRKYCSRKHMEYAYYYRRRGVEPPPIRKCELCDGPLNSHSKYGVCSRNPECSAEYWRRVNNSPAVMQRREKSRHKELTYLMYSPLLNSHKIGRTTNISSRFSTVRCGCWDVELVITFNAGRKLERWLHNYFSDNRIKGTEWFINLTLDEVKSAVNQFIRKFPGFAELYADSGTPEVEAPKSKKNIKFKNAVEQMDGDDLKAIREYDRHRSGGKYSE